MHVPACAHTSQRVSLTERMHVYADLREWILIMGVPLPSPLGASRVEHGSGGVQLSDVFSVHKRQHGLSSLLDHRRVFS